jgi:hypothetical protein
MKTNYKWTIQALDCIVSKDGLSNVVETIHWIYSGTSENDTTIDIYGEHQVGDPNPKEFTPYEDLTLELVSQWLESATDMEELQQNIENQINELENPTYITLPLPSTKDPETI